MDQVARPAWTEKRNGKAGATPTLCFSEDARVMQVIHCFVDNDGAKGADQTGHQGAPGEKRVWCHGANFSIWEDDDSENFPKKSWANAQVTRGRRSSGQKQ